MNDFFDFVRIQGRGFAHAGQPLVLRGLGVGSWLNLEHFMLGLPGLDGTLRETLNARTASFFADFSDCFFAPEDAAFLRQCGVNFIRVPINHRLFLDDQTLEWREEGFARLQKLDGICAGHGIFWMPDLHSTPGAQNPDWHSESRNGTGDFWQYKALRDQAIRLWREIARRLADSVALLGYDLLNEPVLPPSRPDLLQSFYEQATAAIRQVDCHHIIFWEGDRFAMDFSKLTPPQDPQVAYTFHYYPTVWDATLLDIDRDPEERRAGFCTALQEILDTMQGYQGPLICGEAGYELRHLDMDFAMQLLEDTVGLFESKGISWCLWAYKDAGFMGLVYPAGDSLWMRLVDAVRESWTHRCAELRGSEIATWIGDRYFGGFTGAQVYEMQFKIRAMLYQAEVENALLPALESFSPAEIAAMPGSFVFASCGYHQPYARLLERYCRKP